MQHCVPTGNCINKKVTRGLDKEEYLVKYSTVLHKTYVLCTHKKRLDESLLMNPQRMLL